MCTTTRLALTIDLTTTDAPACYACDEVATGACDRRAHYTENAIVPACARHAVYGSKLTIRRSCFVCGGAWNARNRTDDEGNLVHQKCWDEQCGA